MNQQAVPRLNVRLGSEYYKSLCYSSCEQQDYWAAKALAGRCPDFYTPCFVYRCAAWGWESRHPHYERKPKYGRGLRRNALRLTLARNFSPNHIGYEVFPPEHFVHYDFEVVRLVVVN